MRSHLEIKCILCLHIHTHTKNLCIHIKTALSQAVISGIQSHNQLESPHHTIHSSLKPGNGLLTTRDMNTDADH